MKNKDDVIIRLVSDEELAKNRKLYLNQVIFDLDSQLNSYTGKEDNLDYFVSIGSGLICGAMDVLWVGDFNLLESREISSEKLNSFVKKVAKLTGCKSDDLKDCVKYLEDHFRIPSDGSINEFGGGYQHHFRDFAHHPTIFGLIFSLLTQFTEESYGTDKNGLFIHVSIPESHKILIGKDVPQKISYGTIIWFMHLVSDMAGSSSSILNGGGTGIPGPILSLAKELSSIPLFKEKFDSDNVITTLLSKLFNGPLLAERDKNGKIIKGTEFKFDLRAEMGIATDITKQAVPIIANDIFVRIFYFIRRLITELKINIVKSVSDFQLINWANVVPKNNPTLSRMLAISSGVFTFVDITDAIISKKYWVSVNFSGIGRFSLAIGQDVSWYLKARNIKEIKQMYENIKYFTFMKEDNETYKRMQDNFMAENKFGLNLEQTIILYNLEYQKVLNDICISQGLVNKEKIVNLKRNWLNEWKDYMEMGFSSFIGIEDAKLIWYSQEELLNKIKENNPNGTWFKLVLLEAMLFDPYYPLTVEKDKKGQQKPSKKYNALNHPLFLYSRSKADLFLDSLFPEEYYSKGLIKRLRKSYDKCIKELNEVKKSVEIGITIAAIITIITVITAGAFAPAIATVLVGSEFVGLNGAALTSACLAYLGGGAIAAGGGGMAVGTIAIVGGGAIVGLGTGTIGGVLAGRAGLIEKHNIIMQSAKLMVSIREVFLNEEQNVEYSWSVYEQYVSNIEIIKKNIVELEMKVEVASNEEKKKLQDEIKKSEESVHVMIIAMRSLKKFISSYEEGMKCAG